jgi:hypothetical protein
VLNRRSSDGQSSVEANWLKNLIKRGFDGKTGASVCRISACEDDLLIEDLLIYCSSQYNR